MEIIVKYGINMDCFAGLEPKKAAELMKINGFSTTFVGTYYPKLEAAIDAAAENGLEFEFLHAPFRGINPIWEPTLEGEEFLKKLTDAVDIAEKYGIKALACHVSSGNNPPNINDVGLLRFARFIEYAKSKNVRLAFENQRKIANLAYLFEKFPDITFCWDTGHEECFAHGTRFMPLFGDKLDIVHIHDNHKLPDGDDHMLPFDAEIDFERVAKSLAEANLKNSLMLEVDNKPEFYSGVSPEEFFSRAAAAVRKLADMVDYYRG